MLVNSFVHLLTFVVWVQYEYEMQQLLLRALSFRRVARSSSASWRRWPGLTLDCGAPPSSSVESAPRSSCCRPGPSGAGQGTMAAGSGLGEFAGWSRPCCTRCAPSGVLRFHCSSSLSRLTRILRVHGFVVGQDLGFFGSKGVLFLRGALQVSRDGRSISCWVSAYAVRVSRGGGVWMPRRRPRTMERAASS
jgi:hypothetical protein